MEEARGRLVGTRLALVGVVLYFLEWVGIVVAPSLPTDKLGHDQAAIVHAYVSHPARTAFLAGWLSAVLIGRVLFVLAARNSLRDSGYRSTLADWAVAAMAISVVIEVVDYALVASAGWLAHAGASAGAIVGLDTAGTIVFQMVLAPIGISTLALSLAMLASGLFWRWLPLAGAVIGALLIVGGIISASAQGSSGSYHDLGSALQSISVFLWWLWLIATAVVFFRAAPGRSTGPNRTARASE